MYSLRRIPRCILLILTILLSSCSDKSEAKLKHSQLLNQKVDLEAILNLAHRQDADARWMTPLEGKDFYTIALQKALKLKSGQKLLAIAEIEDVAMLDTMYLILAVDWSNEIFYQLRARIDHVNNLLEQESGKAEVYPTKYAIVFIPKNVISPISELSIEIDQPESEYDLYFPYISYDASDIHFISGECIDLVPLRSKYWDNMDTFLSGEVRL